MARIAADNTHSFVAHNREKSQRPKRKEFFLFPRKEERDRDRKKGKKEYSRLLQQNSKALFAAINAPLSYP